MLEDVLSCKTTLPVNAMAMKDVNTLHTRSTWSPGASTYKNIADN